MVFKQKTVWYTAKIINKVDFVSWKFLKQFIKSIKLRMYFLFINNIIKIILFL